MKRVVFPLLLLLCTATGCPPPGTTPPGQCLDCGLAGKIPNAAIPPVMTWKGDPIPPAAKRPGRAFLFESPKDPAMYWAVVVDGDQVTARYELPATSLGAFISPTPEAPTGNTPVRASPIVKVGGPPRPMHVVVPAPTPAQTEDPAYWLILACLQDMADARAATGSTASTPQPKTN